MVDEERSSPIATPRIERTPTGRERKWSETLNSRTRDHELYEYIRAKENKAAWIEAACFLGMYTELSRGVSMIELANNKRDKQSQITN